MTRPDVEAPVSPMRPDAGGLVRLPALVRGELVFPREIGFEEALAALGGRDHVDTGSVQILRQTVLEEDRSLLFLLPSIADPAVLTHDPGEQVIAELGRLPAAEVAAHLERVGAGLTTHFDVIREVALLVDDTPIAHLDAAFANLGSAFAAEQTLGALDRELAFGDIPGRSFIDDWVRVGAARPGLTAGLSGVVHGSDPLTARDGARVHAAATRQLHITAGNSPVIPIISAIRGLTVRGAVTLKVPAGALVAGSALALALHAAGPDHPLTRACSVVYWRGGDERIEQPLLVPGMFDRIVVWGAPDAVDSVVARCGRTKTLLFNPRYGVSLVGSDALAEDRFADTVRRAATDALVWNQRACIAALVCYVEADASLAHRFAEAVAAELDRWDTRFPRAPAPDTTAALRRARRGGMRQGRWYANGDPKSPSSATVVLETTFDLSTHPASRVLAVRPVPRIGDVLSTFHHGVSQVGVAPDELRLELRERICAYGVTGVLPLGEADATDFTGVPQDGMRSLSELTSWVTG